MTNTRDADLTGSALRTHGVTAEAQAKALGNLRWLLPDADVRAEVAEALGLVAAEPVPRSPKARCGCGNRIGASGADRCARCG